MAHVSVPCVWPGPGLGVTGGGGGALYILVGSRLVARHHFTSLKYEMKDNKNT